MTKAFDLEVKIESGTLMYVSHLVMLITPYAKYGKPMSNQKIVMGRTKTYQKPYKFDLEIKVQGRIWIINVRDTSSYCDTPMCQIW